MDALAVMHMRDLKRDCHWNPYQKLQDRKAIKVAPITLKVWFLGTLTLQLSQIRSSSKI